MPNDYFLTKIYESMKNKKDSSSLSKPKNIQQAYYQVVLKQINEDADILMQNKDETGKPYGDVEEFTVTDDVAKQIKSSIRRGNPLINSKGESTNIEEIVKKVLTLGNWNRTSNLNFLIENIVNIFSKQEIVLEKISNYPELLEKSTNILKEKLINQPQSKVNLKDLIPDWFNSFFETNGGAQTVNALWDLVPNTKPSSGRGELLFTLISRSKKAPEGDLLVESEMIEMKGSDGTMEGDGHIIDTSLELNEILKKDLVGISMTNRKKEIIKRIERDIQSVRQETLYKEFREKLIQQIETDEPLDKIHEFIKTGPLNQNSKNRLHTSVAATLTIPKFNFRDSLLAFFSQQEFLTTDQLAEGVFAARNYKKVSSPDAVKNKIKEIINNSRDVFFKKDHERIFTYELAALISALHVCAYQEVYKFKGIIFANDKNKNMVYCNFTGNTINENLERIYSFIMQFKPSIKLTMSKMQKAAGFVFFET
jgi:hypothetical protein